LIDEIVREGARRMLAAALEAEVAAYIAAYAGDLDERVTGCGPQRPRGSASGAHVGGVVPVRAPRVNDKRVDETTGERRQFSSAILPACAASPRRSLRCCRCCTARLVQQDFVPALEGFLAPTPACPRRRSPG